MSGNTITNAAALLDEADFLALWDMLVNKFARGEPTIARQRRRMDEIDLKIDGKAISLSIVTGLDALSRSGDLDALRQALGDINSVNSLPPAAQEWLNLGAIYSTIMNGHGLPAGKYVKDEATVAQQRQAQQAAMQQQAINEASATAGAQAVAQQATEGQA